MTTHAQVGPPTTAPDLRSTSSTLRTRRIHRSAGPFDRKRGPAGAHRTFRVSVVVSAVRCVVTYVAVPVLLPLLSLSGWVAAPIGLALCVVAAVSGVISLRRFWRADHAHRWTYTAFIAVVMAILTVATVTELDRIGAAL